MSVLLAVVKELWTFATGGIYAVAEPGVQSQECLPPPSPVVQIAPVAIPVLLSDSAPISSSATAANEVFSPLLHASFIAVTEAFVYREPVAAFDAVLVRLPYATRVQVAKRSGRFVQVAAGVTMGWVDADSVASGAEVLPQLKRGVVYDAASTEAVRLRTCIADSFNGRESGSMLTGVEYVTYRLWQQARVIPWPVSYGRVAGTWQRKLRGVRGVHIDVMPRTGAIMEYILDEVGYLAYVEAVSPDLRIRVTGIGLTHEGQYTEQVFEHGHWRELHPVFIQV